MLRSLAAAGFSQISRRRYRPLASQAWLCARQASRARATGRRQCASNISRPMAISIRLGWSGSSPLRIGRKLVGLFGLGEHLEGADYDSEEVNSVQMVGHYCALAVHNYSLSETLATRISENLRLLSSVHAFYDSTLEVLAAAIDIKDINIHGHSMRVGAYGATIAHALGMSENEIAGVRASGYLHDIGKVAVDRYLFNKADPLNSAEFRQLADHTVLGYEIVKDVEFPWASIPEVVRSHHERADGTGYPDGLPALRYAAGGQDRSVGRYLRGHDQRAYLSSRHVRRRGPDGHRQSHAVEAGCRGRAGADRASATRRGGRTQPSARFRN